MKRFITSYKKKVFDLIVIGGGITGATVAYEAASRGLSVALIEKSDFGSATSSATSRMIHGGLRYLSTFEFGLVRESLRERRVLMNIAPNFVHPSPFLFATYKKDKVSHITMKTGMFLYELLSFDKNRLKDKSKKMPHFKSVSSNSVLSLIPNANKIGLTGAHLYYDCSSHSPERLTLSFLKSAVKYGAEVANYTELVDFIIDEKPGIKTIKGIKAVDRLSGDKLDIKGDLVINCSGPWADIILDKAKNKSGNHDLRRSEGIHIITKKLVDKYTFSTSTAKGKHFFLIPYRNHTLIGTTDKEYTGKPDEYKVTRKAIEELLDDVNNSFGNGEKIEYEDVLCTYGGLRPLVEDQTEDVYQSSRKYEITGEKKNGIEGLITIEGGKFTTSRMLAEKAIDKALTILKQPKRKSNSRNEYLAGSEIDNFNSFVKKKQDQYPEFPQKQIEFLAKSYGTEIDELFTILKEDLSYRKNLNSDGENLAQVVYAIRNEMAMTLSDIMLRRTGLALLGHPGKDTLEKVAKLAAKELKWDDNKMEEEVNKMETILQIPE
jgi:glycerol-3-phosphate dehydrogenase